MDAEEALKVANAAVFAKNNKRLTDLQELIFRGSWQGQKYDEIAEINRYEPQHIKNEGSKLWKLLTQALGEKVSKTNFQSALKQRSHSAAVPQPQEPAKEETPPRNPVFVGREEVITDSFPEDDLDALVQKVELLQVSPDKIEQVKEALDREIRKLKAREPQGNYQKGDLKLTQKVTLLAKDIKLAIQTTQQFFAGQPVERQIFIHICSHLKLKWRDILDVDFLKVLVLVVPQVRLLYYAKIQDLCGTLRILDVARSIDLDELYVHVNILNEPNSYARLELSDLPQVYNSQTDEFDRFVLGKVRQARVPGLDAVLRHHKLMLLGKPGAGKSTFLQHIAIRCNQGDFQTDRVPIFIRLKTFAEDAGDTGNFSLLHYISQEFNSYGIAEPSVIEKILKYGKALILLDGLDEVSEDNGDEVVIQIRRFCDKYYKNQFITTCRIAAFEYRLPGFTDVEIADFDDKQIKDFAKKWFMVVARHSEKEGQEKATRFIEELSHSRNQQIREIAITPILLTLTCLVFQYKAKFPANRAKLYEEGLEILLRKWDEFRRINRDEAYRSLSVEHKKKLLSKVAAINFENNRYFFEQDEIQQYIADYLRTLPDARADVAALQQDSEAVLKSIEAQHGLLVERARRIYSFSHLTFQEYFTAKAIINSFDSQTLEKSVSHVTNKSWREVFLLASGMMPRADKLLQLMKQQVDDLVAKNDKLQQFLIWLDQKSSLLEASHKPAAIRALYLALDLALDLTLELANALILDLHEAKEYTRKLADTLDLEITRTLDLNLASSFAHARERVRTFELTLDPSYAHRGRTVDIDLTRLLAFDLALKLALVLAPEPVLPLQKLKAQLPNPDTEATRLKKWRQAHSRVWIEKLKAVITQHPSIGHYRRFSNKQKELLKQYHDANKLLVACLTSASNITIVGRSHIEDTLLLPIAEIEKRRLGD